MGYTRSDRICDYLAKCNARIAKCISKEILKPLPNKKLINELFDQTMYNFKMLDKFAFIRRRHYCRYVYYLKKQEESEN